MDDEDDDKVVHLHKWTKEEFARRKAELVATYGVNDQEAAARREQEFARLYDQSGWTQVEIAEFEGMAQSRVSNLLRFGRFLDFPISREIGNAEIGPIPAKLTEGTFRKLWKSAQGNDYQRFIQIRRALSAGTEAGLMTPQGRIANALGKQIIEHVADSGKYVPLEEIIEKTGQPEALVRAAIDKLEKTKGVKIETKRTGRTFKVRAFRDVAPVPYAELRTKLMPIIEKAEENAKKHKALIVPSLFGDFAHMLRKFLSEWEA